MKITYDHEVNALYIRRQALMSRAHGLTHSALHV